MSETTAEKQQAPEKIDIVSFLYDILNRLRTFWLVIVILTVGCGALNYFRSSATYKPSYRAEATVAVEILNGGTYANENTAEQMGNVFPYILTSGALSEIIASDLGMTYVPGSISVSSIDGTNLLTISVTGSDPDRVYKVLQSVLKNYPEVARYVVGQTNLTVIDESGVPKDTGKTEVVRGSIRKGLLIGFGIGVVLLIFYTLSTRTVRTEKDLTRLINVPFLGTLPVSRVRRNARKTKNGKKQKGRKRSGIEINMLDNTAGSDYTEAMRLVRTRMERQMGDGSVIMVTSSIPGEGKSTVAANLAVSFAEKGRSVILVDCDLRNPTQRRIFGLEGEIPGLQDVIHKEADYKDALVRIHRPEDAQNDKPLDLSLIPGSEKGSNSISLLESETMQELVDTLKKEADIVILDTPPSAILADAMMLTRHADGICYVVMYDFAKRRVIVRGMEELKESGISFYGSVLNGGKPGSASGHYGRYGYYGYGYRTSRYAETDTETT
ncbi:MAG: polysaccharide biosynthesis tyrosine autokinase [Lachnospiraceae bacterium]|nr:polysaccharide biosynthesis tyrosine autokinase [Lachnospiraceae bacterium]